MSSELRALHPCWNGVFTLGTCCMNDTEATERGCWEPFGGELYTFEKCCDLDNSMYYFAKKCWQGSGRSLDVYCRYNQPGYWSPFNSPPLTYESCCAPEPWKPPKTHIGSRYRQMSRVALLHCGPDPFASDWLAQIRREFGCDVYHQFSSHRLSCFAFYHFTLLHLASSWMLGIESAAVVLLSPFLVSFDMRRHLVPLVSSVELVLRDADTFPTVGFASLDASGAMYFPVRRIRHKHWKLVYADYYTGYDRYVHGVFPDHGAQCFGGDTTSGSRVYSWQLLRRLLKEIDSLEDAAWLVSLDIALKAAGLPAFTCSFGHLMHEEDYLPTASLPEIFAIRHQLEIVRYSTSSRLRSNCWLSQNRTFAQEVAHTQGLTLPYCYRAALQVALGELVGWWQALGKCNFDTQSWGPFDTKTDTRSSESNMFAPPFWSPPAFQDSSLFAASNTASAYVDVSLLTKANTDAGTASHMGTQQERLLMPPCTEHHGRHVVLPDFGSGTHLALVRNARQLLPWEADADIRLSSIGVSWLDVSFFTEVTATVSTLMDFRQQVCDELASTHSLRQGMTPDCETSSVLDRRPEFGPLAPWARERTLQALQSLLRASWRWAFVRDYFDQGGGTFFVFEKVTVWEHDRTVFPRIDVVIEENVTPEEVPVSAELAGATMRLPALVIPQLLEGFGDAQVKKSPKGKALVSSADVAALICKVEGHNACLPNCQNKHTEHTLVQLCEFDDPLVLVDRFD